MRHVAYYISGHGYGHAVRSIEVIKALTFRNPYLFFHIKTTAPKWFFPLNLVDSYLYYKREFDVGTVQHDFSEVDKQATLKKMGKMLAKQDQIIEKEIAFFRKNQIELVIGDIPPLVFTAANGAGIHSVAIGNFSWDWIYRSFLEEFHEFDEVISQIEEHYRQADLLLRLPMHGDMNVFRKIIDIPLIARKAKRKAKDVRRMLKISDNNRSLVLVALRPADLRRVNFNCLANNIRLNLVILNQERLVSGMMNLPQDLIPFQELVNAADVVVSKPGYGIVSECIVNRTPLVFTERKDFPEYPILEETLKNHGVGEFISLRSFFEGNWQAAIEIALRKSWPEKTMSYRGAAKAAEHLLRLLNVRTADIRIEMQKPEQLSLLEK